MSSRGLTEAGKKQAANSLNREIRKLGREYTIYRDNYISDGANGKVLSTSSPSLEVTRVLGIFIEQSNSTSTNISTTSDGGRTFDRDAKLIVSTRRCLEEIRILDWIKVRVLPNGSERKYRIVSVNDVDNLGIYTVIKLVSYDTEVGRYG